MQIETIPEPTVILPFTEKAEVIKKTDSKRYTFLNEYNIDDQVNDIINKFNNDDIPYEEAVYYMRKLYNKVS